VTPQGAECGILPFEEKWASDNLWVIMAKMIPWSEFDGEYAAIFAKK